MGKLFISHSSQDDGLVRGLQQTLADWNQGVWIDSRELLGGDRLWPEIQQAIDEAEAYAVVVSPDALQSKWVGKELRHALQVQAQRGPARFPVIPLSLNNTKLGVLEEFFGAEPVYIPVSSQAGGIDAALKALFAALGKILPPDPEPEPQAPPEPLAELVLELTDLSLYQQEGKRRAQAKARLVYQPADPAQREVVSAQSWRLIAPLGPIEIDDLRWYLERYAIWPSRCYSERKQTVEKNLVEWGKLLYQAALPLEPTANVLQAWAKLDGNAGRRFSVWVDNTPIAGLGDEEKDQAREAATLLLGLPWELLHDGHGFLFQGAKPVRVRRRLPNCLALDIAPVATPIRVLLVTARPEDAACGYLDHRASALPLVEAMETLGGVVKLHCLEPPTLPALSAELARARELGQPYHVVHFDGHGVYDRRVGLGGLCFEHPQDLAKLEQRRHQTIHTDQLGPLLREHRIPLVFLEACQTAQADSAAESVAAELLKVGVASVVAMSHSVLVETARRFVAAFYLALAQGRRVGEAMLAGQRELKADSFRGQVFGAGELRLDDWFVPVLFQEKQDPVLFRAPPSRATRETILAGLRQRLGAIPGPPATGFIGRSRELLALQRLLKTHSYAVVRGQGGEGKTALACELARWLVRSQQIRRAAFVSVELHSTARSVLDALGRQLVPDYTAARYDSLDAALRPVQRALAEQTTLIVLDNLESILPPPYLAARLPEALAEDAAAELQAILDLCQGLLAPSPQPLSQGERGYSAGYADGIPATRIVFTSREALPAPFAAARHQRELRELARDDAVRLVEKILHEAGTAPVGDDATTEAIHRLVDAVHGHARTLALLAPSLVELGVEKTRSRLVALMAQMHQRHPDDREQSLYASVELSLRRLSPDNRAKARVLGLFHGGVDLDLLRHMMEWEKADVAALAAELIATGLATANPYDHLSLNPALCPYLLAGLDAAQRQPWLTRWCEAMRDYVRYLVQQSDQNAELAATLTGLEQPNLFALLELTWQAGDAEAAVNLATALFRLLQNAGKPRLLARVGQVRDAAAAAIPAWNHARFEAQRTRIEQQLAAGRLREALTGAQDLLERARSAGEQAYPVADYDLAMAQWLLARALKTANAAEAALSLLDEAQRRFEIIAQQQADRAAEGMASACLTESGECLIYLGRLDAAAAAYEENIRRAEQLNDERQVAVGQGQLGTVRLHQGDYPAALQAYAQARERFMRLDEPGTVAVCWHQIGRAYQQAGQFDAAEDAYRQALAVWERLGDVLSEANTLGQLGWLYHAMGRLEDAVSFTRWAAERSIAIDDQAKEGVWQSDLAEYLRKLRRLDEARQAIQRAVACNAPYGHASEPWRTWDILADIETDAGQPAAAAEARAQAQTAFLAHRRAGGENHSPAGRLAAAVAQALQSGQPAAANALLQQNAADYKATGDGAYLQALQALVNGSRDPRLAADPNLSYDGAAEILLLLEQLPAP